jgi:hypothetical protein
MQIGCVDARSSGVRSLRRPYALAGAKRISEPQEGSRDPTMRVSGAPWSGWHGGSFRSSATMISLKDRERPESAQTMIVAPAAS